MSNGQRQRPESSFHMPSQASPASRIQFPQRVEVRVCEITWTWTKGGLVRRRNMNQARRNAAANFCASPSFAEPSVRIQARASRQGSFRTRLSYLARRGDFRTSIRRHRHARPEPGRTDRAPESPALTVRHCTRMEVRAPRILRPRGASEPCERSGRGSNFRPRTPEADLEPMRTTGSPVLPRRASPVEPRTKIRVARPLDVSDFPSTDGQGGSHRDGPGVDLGENPFII